MIPEAQKKAIGGDAVNIDRVEDKYILDKKYLAEVISQVSAHLDPYYPDDETAYTLVRSIYFDSDDFTFLKQHLAGQDDRRKLRIRTYGPDGEWENEHFLEDKYKEDGKSKKQRIKLSDEQVEFVINNARLPIDPKLVDLNQDLPADDFLKKAKLLNYLMLVYKVKPVCAITYKRFAYQDGKLRVTIDQDISVKPLRLFPRSQILGLQKLADMWEKLKEIGTRFYAGDNFVLEVKHDQEVPDWLKELLKEVDAEPKGFSKYVFAMYNIFTQILHLGVSR